MKTILLVAIMLIMMMVDACSDSFACPLEQDCVEGGQCYEGLCLNECMPSKTCFVDNDCDGGFCYNGYCKTPAFEDGKCYEKKHCRKESTSSYPLACVKNVCTEIQWRKENGQPCTGSVECDSANCNPDTKKCEAARVASCRGDCTSDRMCGGLYNRCVKDSSDAAWGECCK
ncbi:hypothetical protein BC940DRAFT_301892 [Gongronella butleri]|nr:hypothetical protein BC940DRAFT_301892 [Gongronella butleri]